MGERDNHAERSFIGRTGQIIEFAHAVKGHFVIVIQVERGGALTGGDDAKHVVIPLLNAFRVFPVGRPGEVGGVDVGGEPLFKAMQLVSTNKVHLTAQNSLVAQVAQIVGKGGNLRRHFAGVVIDAGVRGQLTGQHGKARGGAEWRVTIGIVKDHPAFAQGCDIGRFDDGMAVDGQSWRCALIGLN